MNLESLNCFLAAAQEHSLSRAAETLHVSQPTLSRRLKELENELGTQLYVRHSHSIQLTETGQLLKERAQDILGLVQSAEDEIRSGRELEISGRVSIGAAESWNVHVLTRAAVQVRQRHPGIALEICSGDFGEVLDSLNHGSLDFGLVLHAVNEELYESLRLPGEDRYVVLMRRDAPLADRKQIRPEDLTGQPLILARTMYQTELMDTLLNGHREIRPAGLYNLIYNGSLMVEDGLGYAIALDRLIHLEHSALTTRPLTSSPVMHLRLIWKRYRTLSRAAQVYLETLQEQIRH